MSGGVIKNRSEERITSDDVQLAHQYLSKKKFKQANLLLETLLERDPYHEGALLLKAKLFHACGEVDQARILYLQLLEDTQGYGEVYREFASFLLAEDTSLSQAETHLLTSLTHNPHDAIAHVLLADVYCRTNRLQQAILHLEIAVRFPMEDSFIYHIMIELLTRIQKSGADITLLRQILVSNTGNRTRGRIKRALSQQKNRGVRPVFASVIRRVWIKNRIAE